MMRYPVTRIIQDVRDAIDRNSVNIDILPIDINTRTLDVAIRNNIEKGVRIMLVDAPILLLGRGVGFSEDIVWEEHQCGYIVLPKTFFRLISFRMSDWKRALTTYIEDTDTSYSRQRSPIKALRGNSERPVIAIVPYPDGKHLEFYSCDSEDAQVIGSYLPIPFISMLDEELEEKIDIPRRCYHACVAMIGSLVIMERGSTEFAQVLETEAKELIKI